MTTMTQDQTESVYNALCSAFLQGRDNPDDLMATTTVFNAIETLGRSLMDGGPLPTAWQHARTHDHVDHAVRNNGTSNEVVVRVIVEDNTR